MEEIDTEHQQDGCGEEEEEASQEEGMKGGREIVSCSDASTCTHVQLYIREICSHTRECFIQGVHSLRDIVE